MIERELHKTFISNDTPIIFNNMDDETVIRQFKGFSEFMMMYNCAIKEVRTKFEVLNDDFSVAYNRNPIEMIKSRVKSPISIVEKLKRKNLPLTMAYVPFQKCIDSYDEMEALKRGTLYPELDKPFYGNLLK